MSRNSRRDSSESRAVDNGEKMHTVTVGLDAFGGIPTRAIIAAACLMLVACGAKPAAHAPLPSVATTTTVSVKHVASIIAERRVGLRAALSQESSCPILFGAAANDQAFNGNHGTPAPEVFAQLLVCRAALGVIETDAASLYAALAHTTAPPEVSELLKGTLDAAQTLAADVHDYATCLNAASTDDQIVNCVNVDQVTGSVSTMTSELAGWDAYLG